MQKKEMSMETALFMGEFYGPWGSFFFWPSFKSNVYIKIAAW